MDCELSFTLPCFVDLKNTRLAILNYALHVCVFGIVAFWFFRSSFHEEKISLTGRYQLTFWIVGLNPERPSFDEVASTPLCAAPEKYEFEWDDTFKYKATDCWPICNSSHSAHECVRMDMAFLTESSNTVLFLTSLYRSRGGNEDIDVFVPEVLDIQFGFSFTLYTSYPSVFGFLNDEEKEVSMNLGGKFANIFLMILRNTNVNSHGKTSRRGIKEANRSIAISYPGASVLSMREVLELAGLAADLSVEVPEKTRNAKIDGMQYPTLGIAGMTISSEFVCYNSVEEHGPISGVSGWDPNRHDFACTLTFFPYRERWGESRHADAIGSNQYLKRELVGFRMSLSGSGYLRYLDLGNAFVGLMSVSAFMVVPRFIILCLCCYCLGPLSSIYRRAIIKSIDIDKEVACVSAHVAAKALVFEELQRMSDSKSLKRSYDAVEQDDNGDCRLLFHRKAFEKRLISVISAYLKDTSLEAFLEYTKKVDVSARKASSQMIPGYVENIDASTRTQLVKIKTLCALFDTDRRDCRFEWFLPKNVRNSRSSVKRVSTCKKDTRNSRDEMHDSESFSETINSVESRCVYGRTVDDAKSDQISTGELPTNRSWFDETEERLRMFYHRTEQQLSGMRRTLETSMERMCDMATNSASVAAQSALEFERVRSRLCFLEARLEHTEQGGSGIHGTPCSTCERCSCESTAVPIKNDELGNLATQFKHLQEQLREQLLTVRCGHSESLVAGATGTSLCAVEASVGQLHHFLIDAGSRLTYFDSVEENEMTSSVSDVRISTSRKSDESDVARKQASKPYFGSLPFRQEASCNVVISIPGNGDGQ
eukprot:TRINITY_DN6747_c0_g1_i8.p1 TRINITY_DN6747_c0_g1~~TRINITY_DN6747_c0_g1_i8.p1  ORF type:complete len:824 (+),score=104.22 TRINITY_DN6747_c0_g1_i8:38-2509(+)